LVAGPEAVHQLAIIAAKPRQNGELRNNLVDVPHPPHAVHAKGRQREVRGQQEPAHCSTVLREGREARLFD
jgi:hypothetical protein